jgi:hypothetical protein
MAPDKGKPRQLGLSGVVSAEGSRAQAAEASPQYVARYFVPGDSTLFRRHLGVDSLASAPVRSTVSSRKWSMTNIPEIESSPLCGSVTSDGITVRVEIYRIAGRGKAGRLR